MFASIFGGDLNGFGMYDHDWEEYPEQGFKANSSSSFFGAKVIGKFTKESGKATLYNFFGRNKKTGAFELAAQKWLPKNYVRNEPVPKELRQFMGKSFVFVDIPPWLFNKVDWPKSHSFEYSAAIKKEIKSWTQVK